MCIISALPIVFMACTGRTLPFYCFYIYLFKNVVYQQSLKGTIIASWAIELVKYTQFSLQAYPMAFVNVLHNKNIIINIKTIEQLK